MIDKDEVLKTIKEMQIETNITNNFSNIIYKAFDELYKRISKMEEH